MALLNWSNALSSAGGALAAVGLEGVRATLEQQKIQLASKLSSERELATDTRREGYAAAREARQEASAAARQERGFAHSESLQEAGFAHDEAIRAGQQAFQKEQNELNRNLTREQMAAQEKLHKADRAHATRVAQMGGVIQTDAEGNVFMISKDGTTKQIMDPNDKTKPLKSAKDLTPAAKQYAEVLKDRLKALDSNQLMPQEEKDPKIKALNEELLVVLTRGIGGTKKDPAETPTPSDADIAKLKTNPKALSSIFDQKFGAGAAAKFLDAPAATPATSPAVVPAAPTSALPPEPPFGFLGRAGKAYLDALRNPDTNLLNRRDPMPR